MAKVPAFHTSAEIRDGKLVGVKKAKDFDLWCRRVGKAPVVNITFEKGHATRTLDMNALYWAGYVTPLAEYTGYTPLEMHEYLKDKFLPRKRLLIQDASGSVVDDYQLPAPSTTTLDTIEFGEYLLEIKAFALTLGVSVGSNKEQVA